MSVIPSKLTSAVFGEDNPPQDWADLSLLIPHEALRHQLIALQKNVEALTTNESNIHNSKESWRFTFLAEYVCDYLYENVHEHHDNEEKIYFPWISTKAKIPEKYSKSHEDLVSLLDKLKETCEVILTKKGINCDDEVKLLQETTPKFCSDMVEHLKEEEEIIPQLLRDNFTKEEESNIVDKIVKSGGLSLARNFLPMILEAMEDWATPEFYDDFMKSLPPPIRMLVINYYIPDYETAIRPLRDAPTLPTKPNLSRVGCCTISFCFPCIL
jgi:hemerythrin-like domain-containing protein